MDAVSLSSNRSAPVVGSDPLAGGVDGFAASTSPISGRCEGMLSGAGGDRRLSVLVRGDASGSLKGSWCFAFLVVSAAVVSSLEGALAAATFSLLRRDQSSLCNANNEPDDL